MFCIADLISNTLTFDFNVLLDNNNLQYGNSTNIW